MYISIFFSRARAIVTPSIYMHALERNERVSRRDEGYRLFFAFFSATLRLWLTPLAHTLSPPEPRLVARFANFGDIKRGFLRDR